MSSRYDRQMVLPEFGADGQKRLADAHVVVIGAGGLGCPVLSYLAGAGVGRLTIVDPDTVELDNLHRQPLYAVDDIGTRKVDAARDGLSRFNPDIAITALAERLHPGNTGRLCAGADVVVDCADSFAVTYMLSDHCLAAGLPLVSASVLGFSGYAGGFCGGAPSVRAVFPDLPRQAGNCASAGVSGPVVGAIGAIQAQMVLSHLLGVDPPVTGRMARIDLRSWSMSTFGFDGAPEPDWAPGFIGVADIAETDRVVELRGADEAPVPVAPGAVRASVATVASLPGLGGGRRTVLCCASGLRAWNAARTLREAGYRNTVLLAAGHGG